MTRVLVVATVIAASACGFAGETTPAVSQPTAIDERLTLTLVASEPAIVTPIGIAVDGQGRIFVLESHTHTQPADYAGPDGDRIQVFADPGGDRHLELLGTYASGFDDGMGMAFSPAGDLYLVTARGVWRLRDHDGDMVSDEREEILRMTQPASVYAHAALLGVVVAPDGWLYVSRGNTGGSAWTLEGSDGSTVSGYGDGGNVVRSQLDGGNLEEVATGFWNPFGLAFDRAGRLLAADNDPDSRGPNRLVHLVRGGDYGYKSLYGGSGVHPFQAWNAELPGTLPYAAALGEAPSGLIPASSTALPFDYADSVLVAIWEESTIVRVDLVERGATIAGTARTVISGGTEFRPVAFAAARDGTVYLTDWALRRYPNHHRGRIWRLSSAEGPRLVPTAPATVRAGDLDHIDIDAGLTTDDVRALFRSPDPFERHRAVMAAATDSNLQARMVGAIGDADPLVRIGAALALERAGHRPAEPIVRRMLRDPDWRVRRQALLWAGRAGLTSLRGDLARALTPSTPQAAELFDTYLAALEHLQPTFRTALAEREVPAGRIQRRLPDGFLAQFVRDDDQPDPMRALALRRMGAGSDDVNLLVDLAGSDASPLLRAEAVRSLASVSADDAARVLLTLALDADAPSSVRADAVVALGWQSRIHASELAPLLADPDPDVQLETARYLRTRAGPELPVGDARQALDRAEAAGRPAIVGQLAWAIEGTAPPRPSDDDAWQAALGDGGDATRGERVFFSSHTTCSGCHRVDGRGGDLGPALTNVGESKSRQQIVRAILSPSENVAPDWQGWFITTTDGLVHTGRQIDIGENATELYVLPGHFETFAHADIRSYGPMDASIMPDGLEATMTVDELRDLVAFLARRQTRSDDGQ